MKQFVGKAEIMGQAPNDKGFPIREELTTLTVTGDTFDEVAGKLYDLLATTIGEGPSDETLERIAATRV